MKGFRKGDVAVVLPSPSSETWETIGEVAEVLYVNKEGIVVAQRHPAFEGLVNISFGMAQSVGLVQHGRRPKTLQRIGRL